MKSHTSYYSSLWLFLLLFAFGGCGDSPPDRATSMTVQKGTFEITIPAFGELQAVRSTPIIVPTQIRGSQTIAWIVPENTMVKKGETVIRLDAAWYRERIQTEEFSIAKLNLGIEEKEQLLHKEKKELQGELTVTEIEKKMAELYAARDESLYSRSEIIEDAINLEYLQKKVRHFEQKKAQLEQKTRAELQLLQLKMKTHQVRLNQYSQALQSLEIQVPHDGLLIYEKIRRGEKPRLGMSVYRGMKLAKLPDLEQMEAKVYVLESEAAGLKAELPVSVFLNSTPGLTFSGKVMGIDAIAKSLEKDSPLKYFEVRVSLDQTDREKMKPGSQLRAKIFVQRQEGVISVPNQALFFEEGQAFIHIVNGSGLEKRGVKIGDRSLTRTIITAGLEEGEEVVLGNPLQKDGKL